MYNKFKSNNLKYKYLNLRISSKIIIYFSIIFIISTFIISFVYEKISTAYIMEKVKQSSLEALESAEVSTNMIIDNVGNSSKMIISNYNIQNGLGHATKQINLEIQNSINNYLVEFTNFNPNISSIYLMDNYGNKYYSENSGYKDFSFEDVKKSKWYNELLGKNGQYILRLNGGGLFYNKENNYISFIRIINDINSQKQIGILIINIDEDAFNNSIVKLSEKYGTKLFIENENNEMVIKPDINEEILREEEIQFYSNNNTRFTIKNIDKKDYIISNIEMKNYNWKLISVSQCNQLSEQSQYMKRFIIYFIGINFILIILGSMIISSLITNPLKKLCESMKGVENGDFNTVNIKTYNDEVGELKKVYNIMVSQIKLLLDKIREDEKLKRTAELNVLMSQIKPHFLYNTFDAISSLALSGENRSVYEVIKSLGNFYRTSLNNGRDIITIEEEIKTVQSYLIILSIRHKDMFEVQYNLDLNSSNFKIIKLILQPLVENAIYHGFKNKQNKGLITISTLEEEEKIVLSVEDNGCGMDEAQIKDITENKTLGVGVRATKERLKVFYGDECEFIVISKKKIGTKIVIKIPKKEVN